MSAVSDYTSEEASLLLGVSEHTLALLRGRGGVIFYRTKGDRKLHYPRVCIDSIVAMVRLHEKCAYLKRDLTLFELYRLQYEYDNSPPEFGARRRLKYLADLREICNSLVEEGRIAPLEYLVNDLRHFFRRKTIMTWAVEGRIPSVRIGKIHYLPKGPYRQILRLLTAYPTLRAVAQELGMGYDALGGLVRRNKLKIWRGPDAMPRIDPRALTLLIKEKRAESTTLTQQEAARALGVPYRTLRQHVQSGVVASLRFGNARRISLEEVQYWKRHFSTLNAGFEWLDWQIATSKHKPRLLSQGQACRQLGIATRTIISWTQLGLLPFYNRSFAAKTPYFVYLYIHGLAKFMSSSTPSQSTAARYKQLCQDARLIV